MQLDRKRERRNYMNVNWQLCRDKVDNVNWRRGATNVRRSNDCSWAKSLPCPRGSEHGAGLFASYITISLVHRTITLVEEKPSSTTSTTMLYLPPSLSLALSCSLLLPPSGNSRQRGHPQGDRDLAPLPCYPRA